MVNNALIKSDSSPRYIGLVELFYPFIHGTTDKSDPNIISHYLVYCSKNLQINDDDESDSEFDSDDDFDNSDNDSESQSETDSETDSETEPQTNHSQLVSQTPNLSNYKIINEFKYLNIQQKFCLHVYENNLLNNENIHHPLIQNYKNIIKRKNYIKPEIFQKVYLKGGECCAILKTFWIRIVQRSWKRVFKERVRIRQLRKRIVAIMYWQMTNKWPDDCAYMPSIKHMTGLLSNKI